MKERLGKYALILGIAVSLLLLGRNFLLARRLAPLTPSTPDASASHSMALYGPTQSGQSVIVPFPCVPDATPADPNNCGFCGSICGTYGLNQGGGIQPGVSFQQGSCALGVCAPYTVQKTFLADGGFIVEDGGLIIHDGGIADVMGDGVAQDGGTSVRDGGFVILDGGFLLPVDCIALNNGSVYARLQTNPVCISVLSDVNNCGGLGILCNGTCQNGQCAGIRTLPIPIVVHVTSPVLVDSNQIITATGGTAPYYFTFAPNGDRSHGFLNTTTGGYHAGGPNVTDVIEVFDAVGNTGVATIHVVPI